MGLGILKDGKWISERDQEDSEGKFIRMWGFGGAIIPPL